MTFKFEPPSISELSFTDTTNAALKEDFGLGRKLAFLARDLHQARLDSRDLLSAIVETAEDGLVNYKVGAVDFISKSKKLLEDSKCPAGVLLVAAKNVLGPGFETYEPDTIRVELTDNEHINVPPENYDKLFAAITLQEAPIFLYEVNTFANTICAFNDVVSDPEVVFEASPAQLCWGVYEAELVLQERNDTEVQFDNEPITYCAAVLNRNGFLLAPKILSFCQDQLDVFNKDSSSKVTLDEVQNAWSALDKSNLTSHTFTEGPLAIQLAKLSTCQIYLDDRATEYQNYIAKLKTT